MDIRGNAGWLLTIERPFRIRRTITNVHPGDGDRRKGTGMTGTHVLPLDASGSGAAGPTEDDVLVARCCAGETESFRPLVQKHQRRVFAVALRMLGSRADADDASQQAFVDAFRALNRFRSEGRANAFGTWVLAIVVNRCKDVIKAKVRTEAPLERESLGQRAMFAHEPLSPDVGLEQAQIRHGLDQALLKLPPKYREILILKDVEDLPYEEIRGILRLPLTTLKIRVVRARALMRVQLEKNKVDGDAK